MDIFIEQMIKKQITRSDRIKQLGIVFATSIVATISLLFIPKLNFALACAAIFTAYYMITTFNIEYEYIVTNSDIDIDKIISRRKRKRLISFDIKNINKFGKYINNQLDMQTYNHKVYACENLETNNNLFYITLHHKVYGNTLIVFNPNEKIISIIDKFYRGG